MVVKIKTLILILIVSTLVPCLSFAKDHDKSRVIHIYTPQQFADIQNMGNATFVLKSDMELPREWQPFVFSGKLDGAGHSIRGLESALFSCIQDAYICNLVIKDASIHSSGIYAGVLANEIEGSLIDNVKITNSHITLQTAGLSAAGGLAGKISDSIVKNVAIVGGDITADVAYEHVENKTKYHPVSIGGLVGYSRYTSFENSCVEMVTLSGNATNAGGFVGYVDACGSFINCHSITNINGILVTGGFAGSVYGTSNMVKFTGCRAWGSVESPVYAGGFVGIASHVKITNSIAAVRTTSGTIAGGFVGLFAGSSRIEHSHAEGIVQGNKNVGGFVGVVSDIGAPNTITGSYAFSPMVVGTENVRRFAGLLEHDGINNCHAYLGMVVVVGDRLSGVIPNAYGPDGADYIRSKQ